MIKVNNKGHLTWIIKYLHGCILSSIRGIFQKFHISHSVPMSYSACKFRHDRSIIQGMLLAKLCWLYFVFNSSDFPAIQRLALYAHYLKYVYVWSRSIKNKGHFTRRIIYLLACIVSAIGEVFLKHQFSSVRPCPTKRVKMLAIFQ